MRIAYFDCFSGASGDMILGACLDAGLDLESLKRDLASLAVDGYTLTAERIRKQGFAATQFSVKLDPSAGQPHRHLKHVRDIITNSKLPAGVAERAIAVFTRLAEAEAAVHGTTVEKVHFHEVGAVDAIVDIVGACIAMCRLGIERVEASAVPTGSGTVQCQHGTMPVPAPATAELLRGVPLAASDEPSELTTPTGAAILTTLAKRFGPTPAMTLERIGVGAGTRNGTTRANILRLLIGESAESGDDETDQVIVIEANLDDLPGEVVGYVQERLFQAGALDVFVTPVFMKKNRPGTLLTVLAPPDKRDELEAIVFAETTTFGIRSHLSHRRKLARTAETLDTEVGPIRVKVGRHRGRVVTASPEYEDCREAATRTGRPLAEIMEMARRAWRDSAPKNES